MPLVQCSKCIVPGDLPAHGTYTQVAQTDLQGASRPRFARPGGHQGEARGLARRRRRSHSGAEQRRSSPTIRTASNSWSRRAPTSTRPTTRAARRSPPPPASGKTRWSSCSSNWVPMSTSANTDGMTPLTTAVMRDHVPTVKVLLANGADVEEPGPEGFRPLARRHRRGQIRSGQSSDGGRRRRKRAGWCRRTDAADGGGRAERAGRGRDVPAVEHAAARDRQRAHRARRRRECQVEIRHHGSDDCGDA